MMAWLSLRARRIPSRSPLSSVMPPLSMAMSVPVPMAIPTCACASAGASLIPSPAMATMRPSLCSFLTISAFCAGRTSAWKSSIPRLFASSWAVAWLSPVSMTRRIPWAFSSRSAFGVDGFSGSATAMFPAYLPSAATKITVEPGIWRIETAVLFSKAPTARIRTLFPMATVFPSTVPRTPWPGTA